jgi:hypothetical protein
MNFAGEFETHVTVALSPAQSVDQLQEWAARHGLKSLHILLARGEQISQPMITRRGQGTLNSELVNADQLRQQLAEAGFRVTRIKIEAATENDGVPQSDADVLIQPPERYFEHHLKLLLEPQGDLAELTRLAEQRGAHLSRNALRTLAGGQEERFVTQRCWGVGCQTASQRLFQLVDDLIAAKHRIIDIEQEFVVYDSNLEVDAGWLQP